MADWLTKNILYCDWKGILMTKLQFVEELIKTIEDEFKNSEYSTEFLSKEGQVIHTDVGYAFEWFEEYKEILRKRYVNTEGDNNEIL